MLNGRNEEYAENANAFWHTPTFFKFLHHLGILGVALAKKK